MKRFMHQSEYYRKLKELSERKIGINTQIEDLKKQYQDEQAKIFYKKLG